MATNYLSLFRKGYISSEDLKVVFSLLDETVSDEELHSKYIIHVCIEFHSDQLHV